MISSLEDAWKWYEQVRTMAGHMERLGKRFWDREDWAQILGQDDCFRHVESDRLREEARAIRDDLDDLGVLLMFSVFEAIVRDRVLADVATSLPERLHPAVGHAINELKKDIETGSFGKVTEALKSLDRDLIEAVNQVRRYRNWVAHGRRDEQPPKVTPKVAYNRLAEPISTIDMSRYLPGDGLGEAGE
jgi:hypothetical protein